MLALLFVTLPFVVRSVQPVLAGARPRDGGGRGLPGGVVAHRRCGASSCPTSLPAILTGAALAFARCIGEFGSVVLISGNIPYRTEVASVYIYGQVEADQPGAAAAVSVLLLVISLAGADRLRPPPAPHVAPRREPA